MPAPDSVPGGLLRRAGALVLDLLVLGFGVLTGSGLLTAIAGQFRKHSVPWSVPLALSLLLVGAGPFAYFGFGWRRGATVGMRACRLRVVNDADGERLTLAQVVLRLVCAVYSVLFVFVGFLWVRVDPRRRSWHDHYAGSRVMHDPPSPFAGALWAPPPPWAAPGWWGAAPDWGPPPPPPPWAEATPAWAPPPTAPPPAGGGNAAEVRSGWRTLITQGRPPWTWTDVVPLMLLFIPLLDLSGRLLVAALVRLQHGRPHGTLRAVDTVVVDLAAYLPALLVLFVLVGLRRHGHLRDLGLCRVNLRWIGAVLPFVLLAYVFEAATGLISVSVFPNTPPNQCKALSQEFGGYALVALITAVLAAPFVEELFFRGFLLRYLRGRMPIGWAVVISSVIFSVAHFQYGQPTLFLPIFTTGLILGAIYHYSGSIWPGVLTHATFNLVATIQLLLHPHC
ncbi:MAG: hypothetical protein NVS3B18_06340 [Candidatus Dormibacteria bacterium]